MKKSKLKKHIEKRLFSAQLGLGHTRKGICSMDVIECPMLLDTGGRKLFAGVLFNASDLIANPFSLCLETFYLKNECILQIKELILFPYRLPSQPIS